MPDTDSGALNSPPSASCARPPDGRTLLRKSRLALGGAALLLGVSRFAAQAQMVEPTTPPEPPSFDAQGQVQFSSASRTSSNTRHWPNITSPPTSHRSSSTRGLLPPVAERLPKEPLVFKTANMPDGIGVYGDAMRHVIGGRPQAWNFWGGLNYGWGGVDNGMHECLTRTGPLFEVKAEELGSPPNLAKSWEWSEDGHTLTMHIVDPRPSPRSCARTPRRRPALCRFRARSPSCAAGT